VSARRVEDTVIKMQCSPLQGVEVSQGVSPCSLLSYVTLLQQQRRGLRMMQHAFLSHRCMYQWPICCNLPL
jgi:hypothetical protein